MATARLPLSIVAFATLVLVCAWAMAGLVSRRSDASVPNAIATRSVIDAPFLLFRTLSPRDAHGRVALMSLSGAAETRYISPIACARVQYAGGAGLCLIEEPRERGVAHVAEMFDARFVRRHRIRLNGIPVRVRISPNGRYGTITVYGEEESPQGERLATESIIIDMATGRVNDLREFTFDARGHSISGPIDIANVTFNGEGGLFATLTAGSARYLIAGSVEGRNLWIVRPGIANEALSPNNRSLIAKKLVGDRGFWQLTVIDLETWTERVLNQGPRSVDDQVDWLDDDHVVYHDVTEQGTGIWKLAVDGVTGPELLVRHAFSPAVQRDRRD